MKISVLEGKLREIREREGDIELQANHAGKLVEVKLIEAYRKVNPLTGKQTKSRWGPGDSLMQKGERVMLLGRVGVV